MIRPIEYIDYDKISDDILYLGSKLYLRMNVSLSSKDGNSRYHFHREYNYQSEYGDDNGFMSIKRSFYYYLSFDKTDEYTNVMIRPQDMILLQNSLKRVAEWFDNGTFGVMDNKIVITKKRRPIVINGLAGNTYLQFDPIVINYDDGQIQGIQIILGDPLINAAVNVDNFFGLLYTINTFDMFTSAQNMINYLARPDFGTNMTEMRREIPRNNTIEQQEQKPKRKKKESKEPNKNESFFG